MQTLMTRHCLRDVTCLEDLTNPFLVPMDAVLHNIGGDDPKSHFQTASVQYICDGQQVAGSETEIDLEFVRCAANFENEDGDVISMPAETHMKVTFQEGLQNHLKMRALAAANGDPSAVKGLMVVRATFTFDSGPPALMNEVLVARGMIPACEHTGAPSSISVLPKSELDGAIEFD